jgi:ATP-dependent DNA helicase RecQ
VPAEAYHAGLDRERRAAVQRRFTTGEGVVMVATIAFGMGIDKPDVRYLVHFNLPGTLEAYYQQAGRAGRDGEPAQCILLYARRDRAAQQRFIDQAHPDDEAVRETWRRWLSQLRPDAGDAELSGVDPTDSDGFASIVATLRDSGLVARADLRPLSADPEAPIDTRAIAEHRRHAEARLAQMTEYAETAGCRRAVILRYFGERPPDSCDNCDNCLGAPERSSSDFPHDLHAAFLELRDRIATRSGREPYAVFELRTADELATFRPQTEEELLATWGIARTRAEWFGAELLRIIAEWERAHPDAAERPTR